MFPTEKDPFWSQGATTIAHEKMDRVIVLFSDPQRRETGFRRGVGVACVGPSHALQPRALRVGENPGHNRGPWKRRHITRRTGPWGPSEDQTQWTKAQHFLSSEDAAKGGCRFKPISQLTLHLNMDITYTHPNQTHRPYLHTCYMLADWSARLILSVRVATVHFPPGMLFTLSPPKGPDGGLEHSKPIRMEELCHPSCLPVTLTMP